MTTKAPTTTTKKKDSKPEKSSFTNQVQIDIDNEKDEEEKDENKDDPSYGPDKTKGQKQSKD